MGFDGTYFAGGEYNVIYHRPFRSDCIVVNTIVSYSVDINKNVFDDGREIMQFDFRSMTDVTI